MPKKILFVSVLLVQVLCGMQLNSIGGQPDIVLSKKEIILNLVALHGPLSHKSICFFALTNKANNHLLCVLAHERKKQIQCEYKLEKEDVRAIWHKYGSACCYAYQSDNKKKLFLFSYQLSDKENNTYRIDFNDFISSLVCKPTPCVSAVDQEDRFKLQYNSNYFFKKTDHLCFYGIGKTRSFYEIGEQRVFNQFYWLSIAVMRYGFDGYCRRCVMISPISGISDYSLLFFLEYPHLLRAILSSAQVVKRSIFEGDTFRETYLEYSLDDVTIPDDYATRVPDMNMPVGLVREKFSHFPKNIRHAIEKRHQACSKQKKLK